MLKVDGELFDAMGLRVKNVSLNARVVSAQDEKLPLTDWADDCVFVRVGKLIFEVDELPRRVFLLLC